jgi:hypothetical protein
LRAAALGSACASEPVEPAATGSARGPALGDADSRCSVVGDAVVDAEYDLGLDLVGWSYGDGGVTFVGEVCPSLWRDCSEKKVHRPMEKNRMAQSVKPCDSGVWIKTNEDDRKKPPEGKKRVIK